MELAPISTVEEFFNARISTLQIYLEFGKAMLIIVFIFTLMGALNGLYETYRSRKDEFKVFECSGMSREGIRRVKTGEILFTVIFGFFFGIVSFTIYIPLLKMGMETYGVEILTYVMGNFKA